MTQEDVHELSYVDVKKYKEVFIRVRHIDLIIVNR